MSIMMVCWGPPGFGQITRDFNYWVNEFYGRAAGIVHFYNINVRWSAFVWWHTARIDCVVFGDAVGSSKGYKRA